MGTWGATLSRQPLDRLCLNTQTDSSDLTQSPRWQTASNPSRCERASSSETPSSAASKGQGCVQEEGQIDDWSLLQGANGVREDGRRQNWCCGYWALCLSTHTIFANRLHRFFVHGFRWHEQYGRWHKFS